ncbi:hypothetical protein LCGC14_3042470, partial [marine sediment metagenome]
STVSTRVTDGTTTQLGTETALGDLSDELVFGFMQLWQAPAASTTLRVEAMTTGWPSDKRFASIIAIRISDFTDYAADFLATSPDLGDGPVTLATVAYTTTVAADYGFISGAMGPNLSVVGPPDFIRNNLNGGGDVTIGGSETQQGDSNSGPTQTFVHFGLSTDQALSALDTVDADFVANDATTPVVYSNNFLAVFAWSVLQEKFEVGNAGYITDILGSTVNVLAPLTATSYDGVLAANLLDKTATEEITGAYTFANNLTRITGTAIQLRFLETDGTADEGAWRFLVNTDQFLFGTLADDETGGNPIFLVTRTGTTPDKITFSLDADISGALTATTLVTDGAGDSSFVGNVGIGTAS